MDYSGSARNADEIYRFLSRNSWRLSWLQRDSRKCGKCHYRFASGRRKSAFRCQICRCALWITLYDSKNSQLNRKQSGRMDRYCPNCPWRTNLSSLSWAGIKKLLCSVHNPRRNCAYLQRCGCNIQADKRLLFVRFFVWIDAYFAAKRICTVEKRRQR